MYRLMIEDVKDINQFLNLNDLEYVDLFLNKDKSILVSNTTELFAALSLKTDVSADEQPTNIRLPRKMLASLVCDGNITVSVTEDTVMLVFYSEALAQEKYSVSFGRQEVFSASYDNKIRVLAEIGNASRFNAGAIKDIVRIGKACTSVISCQKGVASVTIADRGRVFKTVNFDNSFSISSSRLSKLLSISNTVFDIENYIGIATNRLSILATKCRGTDNSDYPLVQAEKSNVVFEAEFENLYAFLSKMSIDLDSLTINLERRCCDIIDSNKKYSIPVTIKGLKRTGATSEIAIPYYVFKYVLAYKMGRSLKFYNTRNFIRVEVDELTVAF